MEVCYLIIFTVKEKAAQANFRIQRKTPNEPNWKLTDTKVLQRASARRFCFQVPNIYMTAEESFLYIHHIQKKTVTK
jgi:hypothetical protein